jgi:hypothetical protein
MFSGGIKWIDQGPPIVVRSLQILGLEGARVRTLPIIYAKTGFFTGATSGGIEFQLQFTFGGAKEEQRETFVA